MPQSRADVGEFRRRFRWMALLVLLAFVVVIGRLFQLQIVDGAAYASVAHDNVVRRVGLATTRGVDPRLAGQGARVESRGVQRVRRPGARLAERATAACRRARERRAGRVGADRRYAAPEPRSRSSGSKRAFAPACTTDEEHSPCWRPILVREDLSRDIVSELRQHQAELPGTELVKRAGSLLPVQERAGAHALGYLQEVDAEMLARVEARRLRAARRPKSASTVEPARVRVRRHDGRHRRRARVGELPPRPARLGEARGRRARGARAQAPRRIACST